MSVILVDNAYFGHALRRGQNVAHNPQKVNEIRTRNGTDTRLYVGTHNILRPVDAFRP